MPPSVVQPTAISCIEMFINERSNLVTSLFYIHFSSEKLGAYNNEDLTIHLDTSAGPGSLSDYLWISVWCKQAGVTIRLLYCFIHNCTVFLSSHLIKISAKISGKSTRGNFIALLYPKQIIIIMRLNHVIIVISIISHSNM